jgi:hypothetical protein
MIQQLNIQLHSQHKKRKEQKKFHCIVMRYNLSVPFSMVKNAVILDAWALKMEPKGCSETSVRNYRYSLPNNPDERSSQLLRGGSLSHT